MQSLSTARQRSITPSPEAGFYIPSLDGVRALAFFIVFISHAGLKDLVPGGFGVTIFFVLSGFLITTLLRLEFEKNGRVDLSAFYLRRTFRILPLLYLTLGVAILLRLGGELGGPLTTEGYLSQALHWSNYYMISHGPDSVIAGTVVLWSLAVEEHFYLLFPLFFRVMSRRFSTTAQGWLLGSTCAACLFWRLVLIVILHRPLVRTELGTDTRVDSLLFGCLMAIVANPARNTCSWLTVKRSRWGAMTAMPILLCTLIYRNDTFRYTWRFTLQSIALLPIFCYVIKDRQSLSFRILNYRWMTEIGVLSYALYLTHAIILEWFTRHFQASKLLIGIATLVTATIVAKLLQLGVERPFLELRRRFSRLRTWRTSQVPSSLVNSIDNNNK